MTCDIMWLLIKGTLRKCQRVAAICFVIEEEQTKKISKRWNGWKEYLVRKMCSERHDCRIAENNGSEMLFPNI